MEFRRNASERRRRVLIEENLLESGEATPAARSGQRQTPLQNYSERAQRARQPHLTDLIPKRPWTISVLVLSGLAVIAGLMALYGVSYVEPFSPAVASIAALDIERADSLAGWFSAAAFACGSNLAVIIYLLRRHRVDDYRGRYRVWIWFAALLVLASIETIAGIRHVFGELIYAWPAMGRRFTPQTWSVLIVTCIAGAALIRAAIEMRRSRGSWCALSILVVCYAFVVVNCTLSLIPVSEFRTMVEGATLLVGHLALMSTLALYARYVYLDAHGQISAGARKPKREKKAKPPKKAKSQSAKAESASAESAKESKAAEPRRRTDLEVEAAEKRPAATITAANRPVRIDPPQPTAVSDSGGRKLSKAERKKLRREEKKVA